MFHYIVSIITAISFSAVATSAFALRECDDDDALFWARIFVIASVVALIGIYIVCVEEI